VDKWIKHLYTEGMDFDTYRRLYALYEYDIETDGFRLKVSRGT